MFNMLIHYYLVYTIYTSQSLLNLQMGNTFKLGGQQTLASNITSANDTYTFFWFSSFKICLYIKC